MENPFCSNWPGEENWADCQDAVTKDSTFQFPWPLCAESGYFTSCSVPCGGVKADRAASSSKNHSQAEKRRRDRINAQLALLRTLIPGSDKMDKAALLGSVVEQVKDLKRKALEVSKILTVPSDLDEITIDCFLDQDQSSINNTKSRGNIFIKVCICCDDRPELLTELTEALKGLRLMIIQADMGCLGGRLRIILVLCKRDGEEDIFLSSTIQSLKGALSSIASFSTGSNYYHKRSKRQRLFL